MNCQKSTKQPTTLLVGKEYELLLQEKTLFQPQKKVIFVSYTSSPLDVIVQEYSGNKLKVSRYLLRELEENMAKDHV